MHDNPPWIYLMLEPQVYAVGNKWNFKPRPDTRINVTSVTARQ